MVDLNRTIKYFCRIFNLKIEETTQHQHDFQYLIVEDESKAYLTIYNNKTILVQGSESRLKQLLSFWANKEHALPMQNQNSGITIFSQEWKEWGENADALQKMIANFGIPADDAIPDEYRLHRDRMFHDYMFRTKMNSTIELSKALEFIKSWFDKNCFMNLPEEDFESDFVGQVRQYYWHGETEIDIDTIGNALSYAMAEHCSRKFLKIDGLSGCPQVGCDNFGCLFNLVDSIYPYTNANEVVSFNKSNLKKLSNRSRDSIEWKTLLPSTPIEVTMDRKIKEANFPIIPQFQAYDDIHKYRVDFLINTGGLYKIAVECDGLQYHARPNQYIADRKRDRYLQSKNIFLMRFSSIEIFENPDLCIAEIDKQFWAIKRDLFDIRKPYRISYFGV